ncbi:hypothetical protein KFU94_63055, partial [Chloroflexi bacterium TSY]|nr:hypothetical protein [Chloroflexi bacterium TSY]
PEIWIYWDYLLEAEFDLPPVPTIKKGDSVEFPPLSFAQQRLWFLHQIEADNSAYNMAWALKLTGSLNRKALMNSLGEIVRRHEVLRTTFVEGDGELYQKITPAAALAIPMVDLRHLDENEQEAEIQR